jgi:hypothetical protein
VRFGGILRDTVVACAAAAAVAVVAGILLGHFSTGLGLAAGLMIGAFNAHAVAGVLGRKVPFVAGTLVRLVFFSGTALLAAMLLRSDAWAVVLGVGVAQAVMAATAVRQGLTAR